MKKTLAMLIALCMVFSMAFAATASADEPFVVNACIASEPETIDPGLISSVDGSTYTQHQFENLMKYQMIDELAADDPNMYNTEVVCGQAESYEVSDDLCVYTFTLRDDIYWSDGESVTANDFVYAWQRLVDPATASDYGYFLDNIVLNAAAIQAGELDKSELGIEALDDKTLEITLEAPCAYFLEMCAFASLMPLREDVVEGKPAALTGARSWIWTSPWRTRSGPPTPTVLASTSSVLPVSAGSPTTTTPLPIWS